METFEAIRTLLAVREYQAKPLPAEVVTQILEAARLTGSSRNRQAWDFVAVRQPETLQQLGQLATHGSYIADAALAIAVVVPDGAGGAADGARAVQNMMLAAWAAGVGSNWVGNVNTPEIKSLLGIPAAQTVLTVIPFGYPVKKLGVGIKNRKPLAEIAHAERFGQPYSE